MGLVMKLMGRGKGFRKIHKDVIHQYRTIYLTQMKDTLTDHENAVMDYMISAVQQCKQEGIVIVPCTMAYNIEVPCLQTYQALKSLRDKHLIFLYLHHWDRGVDREHCAWLNLAFSGSHYHKSVPPNKWQRYFAKHEIIRYKNNKEAVKHLMTAYHEDDKEDEKEGEKKPMISIHKHVKVKKDTPQENNQENESKANETVKENEPKIKLKRKIITLR